ncbi:MAG: carboxypeptidase M32, partial [bacterium]|nr:carboxypeptidase M32 [bacterium]
HESQSSIWEIFIGQSPAFWKFYFHILQDRFPFLAKRSRDEMFKAINRVKPDFIRIDADPLTYDLHIALRVRLEVALISGDLTVADLPGAWNDGMKELLGITPPTDTLGCLQDTHWASGNFGYFGVYTLGHLMAAQLFETMDSQWGPEQQTLTMDHRINTGNFAPILEWLRANVHRRARSCTSSELMQEVTGQPLSPAAFLGIMTERMSQVYGL